VLVFAGDPVDRMLVVLRGEVEALFTYTSYIPLLSDGAFVCEAALLPVWELSTEGKEAIESAGMQQHGQSLTRRALSGGHHNSAYANRPMGTPMLGRVLHRWHRLPGPAVEMVLQWLYSEQAIKGPRFNGRLRTTCRSLVGELSRHEFRQVLAVAEDSASLPELGYRDTASVDTLQNVLSWGVGNVSSPAHQLGEADISALRVVCDAPVDISCRGVGAAGGLLFGTCMRSSTSLQL
jgi:hypothetical protein